MEQFIVELQKSINLFKPETALTVTFLVAILCDLLFRKSRNISGIIALIGFAVTGFLLMSQTGTNEQAFSRLIVVDPFGQYFKFLILLTSFIIVIISFFSNELYGAHKRLGEYYSLIVGMTFGMFLLAGATNLIMIYLAIETMSISSYILAGYTKEIKRSSEASLKYVIFGAVSSGIMIYGISILFGLTGTLNLFEINAFLRSNSVNLFPLMISGMMIIAGIGYKISAVPFHFWTPDVYEGAPITITAYLSVASKAAGFAILIRFIKVAFTMPVAGSNEIWSLLSVIDWKMIIAVLSILTMTIGNLVAVWQTNLKRLLAYSSIAHAGYILMGVVVMNNVGTAAVLIYFLFYLIMNLGAFYVVMLISNKLGSEDIEDYTGLGYRSAPLAVALAIFLVSLTGLPPTAGFIGKLYIFAAVIKEANNNSFFTYLAIIGVLNSVVSLFYYVKVIRNMFVRGLDNENKKISYSYASLAVAMLFAIPTLVFGLYFTPIVNWANSSVGIFLGK